MDFTKLVNSLLDSGSYSFKYAHDYLSGYTYTLGFVWDEFNYCNRLLSGLQIAKR